ncbi:hypothetical protein CcaverHIS002_0204830 [Cutaneotrichosporon cavernicola]|uniref:Uncharacterized protein n=1 Tax=Cutaneotrichosporon cavernicola TaxID=279322 RepID=A0AA48IAC1_9TREE|nr:uncharacterized protein CcaverHIS019_0204790 [Cutaneotrichosporon cavernicola]BEI81323.1 hypothetical protein CcaverHIS002_0204830 [Cutaneotrichosporon cavernicola]BEI89117.1 hypothetical protein CcaverHIS019_0204790 [Cutaneotrichosporon cavernicola]BEI96894.1 hypothetical protein CcaverHIS631_0204830 [Cutaneotrichosporon cavernicola]BEJ04666.1 hypothetical protein CcaverHIS641_0204830 [Cutaneotrichosporon cavernicola]
MTIDSRPWWNRVFRRKRYDLRADHRVSALPPRLDLKLNTTPMASRFDVNFADAGKSTASLETPAVPKVTFLTPSKSMPDATQPPSDPPPVPVIKATPVNPAVATAPGPTASPSSPSSLGFTRKLHSTTRPSGSLMADTRNMAGYSVPTYVPTSESAASSGESSSSSKRASGESGSASHSEPTPPIEAPIRASEDSAFYSTHDQVPPSEPVMHHEPGHQRPEPTQTPPVPQAVEAEVVQPQPVSEIQPEVQQDAVQPQPVHEMAPAPGPTHREVADSEAEHEKVTHAEPDLAEPAIEPTRLPSSPPYPKRSSSRPTVPMTQEHEYVPDDYASDDGYDYTETREGEIEYDYSETPGQFADTFGRSRTAVAY